jgi:MOSC domain-containing protein YiiM
MPPQPETCAACRFDAAQYDLRDTLGTLRALAPIWHETLEGVPNEALTTRPSRRTWSAAEHLSYCADAASRAGGLLDAALTDDDPVLPDDRAGSAPGTEPVVDALQRLGEATARVHDMARSFGSARDRRWRRTVRVGGHQTDMAAVLRHMIHEVTHHLSEAGRGLHLLGAGAPTQEGTVAHLHASDGGVPKQPIDVAEVSDRGVVGDRQASRLHHGRPLQALCLWSVEVIDALRAEGHPIDPGAAGENVTIAGIDWATVRPGTQLLVGDVLAEISAWATPCKKNAQWFVDRDFNRMNHDRHPGWSRAYAWVREPGTIRLGDQVIVEP